MESKPEVRRSRGAGAWLVLSSVQATAEPIPWTLLIHTSATASVSKQTVTWKPEGSAGLMQASSGIPKGPRVRESPSRCAAWSCQIESQAACPIRLGPQATCTSVGSWHGRASSVGCFCQRQHSRLPWNFGLGSSRRQNALRNLLAFRIPTSCQRAGP